MLELTIVFLREATGFLARIDHGIIAAGQGCSKDTWRVIFEVKKGELSQLQGFKDQVCYVMLPL